MIKKIYLIISIMILGGLAFSIAGEYNNGVPEILSVLAQPQKVKVGDILTITAEIKDKSGIEKVSAIMPYENNRADEIQLSLISGNNKSGKWQAEWKCHNTINIEYITTVTAINILGKSATKEVSWWDDTETGWISGWNYRKKISIEGSTGGAQTLYQVKLLIGESSGTSGTDVNIDGESKSDSIFDDIYFAGSDGATPIDFWRESITGSGSDEIATVWVEVPSIDIGDSDNATAEATIFLYYGNPSASSASNGTNTFPEFFDDFEGASLDTTNKWNTPGSPNIAVANGEVTVTSVGADTVEGIETKSTWQSGYAIRSKGMVVVSGVFVYLLDFCTINFASPQSIVGYWNNGPKAYVSYNGSRESLATSNDFDSYQIHEIRRLSGSFAFYFNDVLQVTHSTNIAGGTDNLVASAAMVYDASTQVKSDWILVRKYAAPEPTAAVVADEEKKPGAPGVSPSGGGGMVF